MPYPRSLADIKKSLTNSGVLGNLYPQMQDVGQDDVDPNRYTLPVEAAPITDRFPGAPRGLYPGMGAGITDEPAPPGTVPTNEPSFSVPAPTGAMNAPASTGDRYQRDEGIPIRPDGVKDSDFVLHGDGTPSKWTWAVMDDMRGFLQTERAKDATRKQNEADRATSRHQTAERLANSGADGAGTSNIPAPTMRPSQTTQGRINDVLDKDYSITKNKDGTVTKGKDRDTDFDAIDVLGGAGLGAMEGLRRGGVIGAIIGAIKGGTDRNTTEKYHDSQTLGRLYPKYQAQAGMEAQDQKFDLGQAQIGHLNADTLDTLTKPARELQKQQNRIDLQKMKDAAEGLKWEPVGHGGLLWKKHNNGREEPLLGKDNKTQEVDLKTKTYKVYDPTTKQTVDVTGEQVLGYSAPIQQGNANREQDVRKTNASNQLKVLTENINNSIQYHASVAKMLTDALTAEAGINDGETEGLRNQILQKNAAYQALSEQEMPDTGDDAADGKARQKQVEQMNKVADQAAILNTKLLTAMSKTAAGKVRADAIRANLPPRPAKLTYTPIEAVQVGGKMVNSAQLDAFAKSKSWTRQQAEAYAKSNGWKIQ